MEYRYPGVKEKLDDPCITEDSVESEYWRRSEERILDIVRQYVALFAPPDRPRKLLDAGCGQGRLLPFWSSMADEIRAIDPDASRLAGAKAYAEKTQISNKLSFRNIPAQDITADERFGIIASSHVIQHVAMENVRAMMRRFEEVLAPEGLLILLTMHSCIGVDEYRLVHDRDPERR
ncbi:MAG: class I SAM-dependent methyltransferase, partial [Nitrososphaera sp.]|nr:class I SAM-dependent methyltransferase [Nitrososphaera sp.]